MIFVCAGVVLLAAGAAAAQSAECAAQPCSIGSAGPSVEEVWQHARRAHELKLDFVAALRDFTRAQTGRVGDEAQALRAGLDAMRDALGRWDRAIGTLETAVAGMRRTADVHVALATVYLDRHRTNEALRELSDAVRLDPRRADVHTLRAHAYSLQARPADAARALDAAAALDPRPTILYSRAHQWRRAALAADRNRPADTSAGSGDVDPVEADLQVGLAFEKFTTTVAAAPDRVLAAREPFERVDLLRQTAGVAPVFAVRLYSVGYAALERGEYREAMSLFERGVEDDPLTRASPRVRQVATAAGAALRRGDAAAAIAALRELVAQTPDEAEAHRLLGVACDIDEQYAASVEHFETAVRLDPSDDRARAGLASALIAAGRTADAERQLLQAAERFPEAGGIQYALGRLYESQARYAEALTAFEASRTSGPIVGRDHLQQTLGRHFVNQSAFDRAIAAYVERIDVNPNHPEAHRLLAEIYFLDGRNVEALAEFAATAFLDVADARAYLGAGQVYGRMGEHARAVAALARAVALGATDGQTRYLLGQALLRVGRADEGRAEIAASQRLQAEAIAAGRDEFHRRAVRREAEEALAAGDRTAAVTAFEQLIAAKAIDMTEDVHRMLAEAYDALGRPQDAARHRERADRLRADRRQLRIAELVGSP